MGENKLKLIWRDIPETQTVFGMIPRIDIRRGIRMSKSVTLKDIAAACHTSNVTVSKALTDKKGVSDELRRKIKETAEMMGYVGPKTAQGRDNRMVGVLIPDRFMNPNGSFYWALYNALVSRFKDKNYFCLIETLPLSNERELIMPKLITESKVSSLVSLGQLSSEYIAELSSNISPLVLLDHYIPGIDLDCVISNGYNGGYELTSYLIKHGHREIGFIGTVKATTSIFDRCMGFMKAMIEHDLEIRKEWIIDDRDTYSFVDVPLPPKLPTAFVCNCDEAAYNLIRQLNSMGIRVPEDISVVGYDNYLISEISKPQITTINVDSDLLAVQTVRCIIERLADPSKPPETVNVNGRLIEKESVLSV